MAKAAVVFVHKAKGEPSPVTDDVIEVMRGLAASKATERGRGQAKAITRDDFAVILARAGEPRKLGRGMETAGLRWGDVEPAASIPGALTIRVRTSKTNRDGEGTDVRLAKNGAAAALTALRPANAAPEALVFRGLNSQSIGKHPIASARTENPAGGEAVVGRVVILEEQLAAVRQALEDVRVDRDHWRALAEREISERPARRGLLGWFR